MNQEAFETRYEGDWSQFERWLELRELTAQQRKAAADSGVSDDSIPKRYRTLCQHLALARDRQYSSGLVERLNRLVMRGHQALYGAHPEAGPAIIRFYSRDFARAVRTEYGAVLAAALLFFGPLAGLVAVIQHHPDFVYTLLDHEQVLGYQEMYDPSNTRPGQRSAQADTFMLGHYIWNNIRIGFQTFAGGLLFGIGTVFFLVFNGVMIGATAGHLLHIGYSTSFLGFVSGHSAFELTGIALMGAAGLKLGAALILPGNLARHDALRRNARAAVPLVYGAGSLLAAAAFIEAFWSPLALTAALKYGVGIALWVCLLAYFLFTGRDRAA
jgi:uncharacterized membrane protein SpoIIM required for sporulation